MRSVNLVPDEEPTEDIGDRPRRLPIPEFFTRRAFLSKDTGRWHVLPGGRDQKHDRPK
jgi:hypothetical protein